MHAPPKPVMTVERQQERLERRRERKREYMRKYYQRRSPVGASRRETPQNQRYGAGFIADTSAPRRPNPRLRTAPRQARMIPGGPI